MTRPILRVISDLHISSDDPLNDFDDVARGHLVGFLGEMVGAGKPFELVINGDFLDFVQAAPWSGKALGAESETGVPLSFTQEQSLAKLEAIRVRHGQVFDALGLFLAGHPINRLTILPGNHDPDFFWPRVEARVKELIAGGDLALQVRINLHYDQVYRPAAYPEVWIEHGHQYDPANRFCEDGDPDRPVWSRASPPIRKDVDGHDRLLECLGTRFLVRYLNGLDANYPYVDNVKPFGRFLKLFAGSAVGKNRAPAKAIVAVAKMLWYVANQDLGDLLGTKAKGPEVEGSPVNWASTWVNGLTLTRRKALIARLKELGLDIAVPLKAFVSTPVRATMLLDLVSEHPDLLDQWPFARADELGLGKGFTANDTQLLAKAAARALGRADVKLVIMGHTHQVVEPSPGGPNYINTGCWTRYYRFDDDEPTLTWPMLEKPDYSLFPFQLNYAEVSPGTGPIGRLVTYKEQSK